MIDLKPLYGPQTKSSKAHLIGDAVWAQNSTYTPPEPIDTSAEAEAKRERKKEKRLRELARLN
jgi:hypothetical protein